jgi:G6PDH family F420-dependent oxidoreductase
MTSTLSVGYFLACEEHGPAELVRQARLAEQAGFQRLWISDHFHPWLDDQGESPFVWGVIGALSQVTSLPITTAVTCPTVRMHPAIVAQAAATAAVQCASAGGSFTLGVGTGEALNEHVTGHRWPPSAVRREMLEEAVEVIRALHTGRTVTHRGAHYTVERARIYTRPDGPIPIYVSAFGPLAARLAGRAGDGLCTTIPDAGLVRTFRESGGGDKPVQGGMKVCWAPSEDEGVATAHRLWRNELLPGAIALVMPEPKDFEAATELVTVDMMRGHLPCGPDPQRHIDQVKVYEEAGFDELYVQQIGPDQEGFFDAWATQVLPKI